MKTKLTEAQLKTNAEALGMNPNDRQALLAAAMVSDPDFAEAVCRLNFEKALKAVGR
jgi:hypothetical protein